MPSSLYGSVTRGKVFSACGEGTQPPWRASSLMQPYNLQHMNSSREYSGLMHKRMSKSGSLCVPLDLFTHVCVREVVQGKKKEVNSWLCAAVS